MQKVILIGQGYVAAPVAVQAAEVDLVQSQGTYMLETGDVMQAGLNVDRL